MRVRLAPESLIFNGHLETNGRFQIFGGGGNDVLIGGHGDDGFVAGAGNDLMDLSFGGADTASGGAGGDTFQFAAAFDAASQVDGGADYDVVQLSGDYTGLHAVLLGAGSMTNVEEIDLWRVLATATH